MRLLIHHGAVQVGGGTASLTIGTNVAGYPRAHEFGFNGEVHVPEHARKIFGAVEKISASGKKRKVRGVTGTTTVRAHTRWLSIPARHWLGFGVADETRTFQEEIYGELKKETERGATA